ncbi:hypothetical protein BSNK01_30360 [Bacillaceae bacterium]
MEPLRAMMEVLARMIEVHRDLLALAKEKKQALLSGSLDALAAVVQKEAKYVKEITELENERRRRADEYLRTVGIVPEPLPLNELIKLVHKAEEKEKLREMGEELGKLVGELRQLNELNQQLIEQSLSYVQQMVALLTGGQEQDIVYSKGQKGKKEASPRAASGSRSFFDVRA